MKALRRTVAVASEVVRPWSSDDVLTVAEAVDCDTVADLLAHWRGHVRDEAGLAVNTIAGYHAHSRALEDVLGAVRLDVLGRRDIDRYRAIVARPPVPGSYRLSRGTP